MRIYCSIALLFTCLTVCQSQKTALDNDLRLFRQIRALYFNVIGKTSEGWPLAQATKERKVQRKIEPRRQFPCNITNTRSPNPPESVHKVRPGDIDILATMGDSLSAGFGAVGTNLAHVLVENRGVSWNGGGQATWREYLTLPNIIKVFNPNVFGYALSDAFTTHGASQFNIAEGLAMSQDMPYMADTLVKRLKRDSRVDVQKHWKLITVMIGPNDFCLDMCWHRDPRSILDKHRRDLITAFRLLKKNLPRSIISLVIAPNLKVLVEFTGRSPVCELMNYLECGCLFGLKWRQYRKEFYALMSEWQNVEVEIASLPEFQTEDFTIVTQPFTTNISFPVLASGLTDFSYLSVDCFHLSQKSYARAANALWNNLLEPVRNKSRNWDEPLHKFLCPTSTKPYISTWKNS